MLHFLFSVLSIFLLYFVFYSDEKLPWHSHHFDTLMIMNIVERISVI